MQHEKNAGINYMQSTGKGLSTAKHATVIVIGAGMAGLTAAKKLNDTNHFDVTILESHVDQIGGRTRTKRSFHNNVDVIFDEGASWIHEIDDNPLIPLAEHAGMKLFTTDTNKKKVYDIGGKERCAKEFKQAEEEMYNDVLKESMVKHGRVLSSFEDVFNRIYPDRSNDRLWKFFLSAYLTFDCGELSTVSSTLHNNAVLYRELELISTNGYGTIVSYLANGMQDRIHLNQRVVQIDSPSEEDWKVYVTTQNGTIWKADYVIVTVPLGVLKAKSIRFVPELPMTKQIAIEKVGYNVINKFLLLWEHAFWETIHNDDDVHYIYYTADTKDKFNYFVNIKRFQPTVNALLTFAYADYAKVTETMTDSQVTNEIMTHLRDIYGPTIPDPISLQRTKWYFDDNSYGSYSYPTVETEMHHFDDLATPIGNNNICFAGEHTHKDCFSMVHGAYLSGIREADRIIQCQSTERTGMQPSTK